MLAVILQSLRTVEATLHVTAWNEHRVYLRGKTYNTFVFLLHLFFFVLQLLHFLGIFFGLKPECFEIALELLGSFFIRIFLIIVVVLLVFVCAIDADVLTVFAVFALALQTVEDYALIESLLAIVTKSSTVTVRIFDEFHPVSINTDDTSFHLLNTIHAVILAAFPVGRPGAIALLTVVHVFISVFALAAVATAARSVVGLVLVDHSVAAGAGDLELGKTLLGFLVKRLQFLLNFGVL